MVFSSGSTGKESPAVRETWVRSLGWEDGSSGEGNGSPLQFSGLENSVDYIVHGITKSRTRLNGFHFHFQYPLMSKKCLSTPLPSVVG